MSETIRLVGLNSQRRQNRLRSQTIGLTLLLVLAGSALLACQVPVFRYALERWSADRYQIVVLHKGELAADERKLVESLRGQAAGSPGRPATFGLKVLDVNDPEQSARFPDLVADWKKLEAPAEAQMYVSYPAANEVSHREPVYQASLTDESVSRMLDSPVRRELSKRLGGGDSVVWIFVPSGHKSLDDAAYARLEKQLAADAKWLELPSAAELEIEPQVLEETKIPLRIGFSILKLARDDAAEDFVLQTLLHSEDDLTSFDQPLAFPVFGRGRVLHCLVGGGIAPDTIRAASAFMAGPCSCQVKNQNPGFDLLLNTAWQDVIGDVLISEPIDKPDAEALQPRMLTIPPGRKSRNR